MKTKDESDRESTDPAQRDWLDDALEATREARFLEQRAQQGGTAAWIIAKLRQKQADVPFQQMSLYSHLLQLARRAGVHDLTPLLTWYKIPDMSEIRVDCADKIARVCRLIGLPWESLLAHVAVSLNPGEPIAVQNWGPEGDGLGHASIVIDELADGWDHATLQRFREIQARMASEYED